MLVIPDDQPDPAALLARLPDSDNGDHHGLLRISTHDERASFVSNVTSPVPSISCFPSESSCNAIEARLFWRPEDAEHHSSGLPRIPEAAPDAVPPDVEDQGHIYARSLTPPLVAALRERFADQSEYSQVPLTAGESTFPLGFTQRPSGIRVSLVQPAPLLVPPPPPASTHRRSLSSSASAAAVSHWISKTGARVAHAVMNVSHGHRSGLSFDYNDPNLSLPLHVSPTTHSSPRSPHGPSHLPSPQRSHPHTPQTDLFSAGPGSQSTTTATTPATLLFPLPATSDPAASSDGQPFVLGPPPPSKKRRSRTRSPAAITRDGGVDTGNDLLHPRPRRSFPQPLLLQSIVTAVDAEGEQDNGDTVLSPGRRRSSMISTFFRSLSPVSVSPSTPALDIESLPSPSHAPRRPHSASIVSSTPPHLPHLPRPTSLRTPPLTHFLHGPTLADDNSTLSTSHTKLFTSVRGSIPTCSSRTDYADVSLGDTTFTTASLCATTQMHAGDMSEFGVRAPEQNGGPALPAVPETILSSRRKTVRIITPATTQTQPSPATLHAPSPPLPLAQTVGGGSSPTALSHLSAENLTHHRDLGSPDSVHNQDDITPAPAPLSRTFFLLGFLLGPWCFLIGALLVPQIAPVPSYHLSSTQANRAENDNTREAEAQSSRRASLSASRPASEPLRRPQPQSQSQRRFGVFPYSFSFYYIPGSHSPRNLDPRTRPLALLSRRAANRSRQSTQGEAWKWVVRCRIAAATSGILITTAFIASVVIVALR